MTDKEFTEQKWASAWDYVVKNYNELFSFKDFERYTRKDLSITDQRMFYRNMVDRLYIKEGIIVNKFKDEK